MHNGYLLAPCLCAISGFNYLSTHLAPGLCEVYLVALPGPIAPTCRKSGAAWAGSRILGKLPLHLDGEFCRCARSHLCGGIMHL